MIRLAALLLMVLALAGCKSHPLGPYVSPRVTGQVLAADTYQPLPEVRVIRGRPKASPNWELKGGELLMLKSPVQTDREGRFVLESERVLSVVRGSGWNRVQLTFERDGYQRFQTNCSIRLATNTFRGEPLLSVGEVLLQKLDR
ncbi:MAG TPA: hypothetical protein VNT26_00010 [Candidatus Sulfotelmatobacter sp.]|nr:hypothetical protein [Candidatus Sulfotelmatobacter sp.]HWI55897.1 hypothetical protein [Bacillota bacterium]